MQAVKLPNEESVLQFTSLAKTLPVPFVIYADLEALNMKLDNCENDNNKSWTLKTHRHEPCSFAYKVICLEDNRYSKAWKLYRGENAIYKFFESIFEEEKEIRAQLNKFKCSKPNLTIEENKVYESSKSCYICNSSFSDKNIKVRDHNHITGGFRGAACDNCNKHLRLTNTIPVIFHNLRGYDSHLLMQMLGKFKRQINVIPNNMEKYMSFSIGTDIQDKDGKTKTVFNLKFIDSYQFVSDSLGQLVKNLPKEKFKYTEEIFKENLEIMTRKGVYPYSFMDSWDKFDTDCKSLTIDDFRNDLTNDTINEDDFKFYNDICEKLNIKTLGEYHDLYLKTDVLLLADVFENFRSMCLEYYGLDPCHYISAPGLSWDALLKMTKIKLDLISDIDMYQFIERGLRGGVSLITHRKGNTNNKYMNNYDKNKPSKYIAYLDMNNLYGWAMSQSLPYSNFQWIDLEEFQLSSVKDENEFGHILEVDLEYPKELHDKHNEYPFCPEHMVVTNEMLSPYQIDVAEKHSIKCSGVTKLIPSLLKKNKYIIHERNLKQAIDAGLLLKKIHRVLRFKQKPWMKEYIDFNTEKRKLAKNDFEKDFFKLMNNSVFGKSMENIRKRQNIKLITDENKYLKYVAKPTFKNSKTFSEDLVAVHYIKEKLLLDKPIYVGFSILDISKTIMYDFHYNYIKSKYGDDAKLLFTDTDSLCYEIQTDDVYKDFYDDKQLFDLSDFIGKLNDNTNKKVIGKMKMEYPNDIITEFVGLKSKMYSIKFNSEYEEKKAKGVVKNVIKKEIKHKMYRETLTNSSQMHSKMKVIRSEKHNMYTMLINKISLSAFDDKRYILNDGISSYAYGHYKIMKNE